MPRTFDVDVRARKLQAERQVKIGEKMFHLGARTPDVKAALWDIAERVNLLGVALQRGKDDDSPITAEQVKAQIAATRADDEGVYEQLVILLRDENDQPPATDLVYALDADLAEGMLRFLNTGKLPEDDPKPEPASLDEAPADDVAPDAEAGEQTDAPGEAQPPTTTTGAP